MQHVTPSYQKRNFKQKYPILYALLHAVVIAFTLLCLGFIIQDSHFLTILLRQTAVSHNIKGIALFMLVGVFICTVGLPRQIVCFMAGFAFGVGYGTALAMLITLLGSVMAFSWARWLARHWVQEQLKKKGWLFVRLNKIHRFFSSSPFFSILGLRLMPVGSALVVNIASGVTNMPVLPFFWATVIGSFPQTIIFVLLGNGIHIGHEWQLLCSIVLLILSVLVGCWIVRRKNA